MNFALKGVSVCPVFVFNFVGDDPVCLFVVFVIKLTGENGADL